VRGFFSFIKDGLMRLTSENISETGFAEKIGRNCKVENLK
jgi:hypothetical protein